MQYNTALGFLLCGLALIFLIFEKPILGRILGGIVSLIGMITLAQYILEVNTGLDELFMNHYIKIKTSHPGRMAPNTALCFLITGLALSLKYRFPEKSNPVATALTLDTLGAIVTGLGLVALTGYYLNLESAYGWGNLTRMAVHTSVGFCVLGLGLVYLAKPELEQDRLPRFPAFIAVALLVISISFWKALVFEEDKHAKNLMWQKAKHLKSLLTYNINQDVLSLERLKFRWENKLYLEKKQWLIDASSYATDKEDLFLYFNRKSKFHPNMLAKQAEEKIKLSEAILKSIIDNSPAIIYMEDMSGKYTHVNKMFEQVMGVKKLDIVGKKPYEVLPRDIAERFVKNNRKVIGTHKPQTMEEQFHVGEQVKTFHSTQFPLQDEGGKAIGIAGISLDISTRKRNEEFLWFQNNILEVTVQEHSLKRVLDHIVIGIENQIGNLKGSILLLNKTGKYLSHGAAPNLPKPYAEAIDGVFIGPSAGSCGTAAYRKEMVIVEDIANDPLWGGGIISALLLHTICGRVGLSRFLIRVGKFWEPLHFTTINQIDLQSGNWR